MIQSPITKAREVSWFHRTRDVLVQSGSRSKHPYEAVGVVKRRETARPGTAAPGIRRSIILGALSKGSFFDYAVAHVVTTNTLDRLRELYPQGRFEARRFRPNMVVTTGKGESDFVENSWVGLDIEIGESLVLRVTNPCPRCVMTTLPQADLPQDHGILRAAARYNQPYVPALAQAMPSVGVYANVLRSGTVRRGNHLRMQRDVAAA